jgi:hypothetical protein
MFPFSFAVIGGPTMRIARLVTPVVVAAAMVTAAPAAATNVVSGIGLPDPLFAASADCAGSSPGGSGSFVHVNGPATPPRGSGSLALHTGTLPTQEAVAYPFGGIPAGQLTTFRLAHLEPVSGAATVIVQLNLDRDGTGKNDRLTLQTAPSGGVWQVADLLAATLAFYPYTGGTGNSQTYAQYLATYPNAQVNYGTFYATGNCISGNADLTAYLDDWRIGLNGTTTVYDFEAPRVTISFPAPVSRIVAGQPVHLTATAATEGSSLAGGSVQLWAKPAGGTYTKAGTYPLNESLTATATQHPKVSTRYQWRRPADSGHAPSRSVERTVKVATRLTLNVADTTLSADQRLKAGGTTTPVAKGAVVKLWKKRAGADLLLARTTTASDGTWHIRKGLAKGRYVIYSTVAATTKNLAGRSREVTVTSA